MARALRIQYPGAYYHITCRGNARRKIFRDSLDLKIFLKKLTCSLEIYNVSLLVYVCMPNHFHLLLTTPEGNLSEFMRHFNISYTSFFNRRHERVGHVYQGRYKAFLIEADNYLLKVSRYIHLNPVRIKSYSNKSFKEKWERLLEYGRSSLPGYLSARGREDFIHYRTVLNYMGGDNHKGRQSYRRFITAGIKEGIGNPLEIGMGHGIVGEDDFIEWVKEKYLNKEASPRELPAIKVLRKVFEPDKLIGQFSQLVGKSRQDICRRGKKSVERAMLMELLYRFCPVTQPDIGRLVGGIDYSAVSQARKRFRKRLEKEPKLKERFKKINEQVLQLSRGKI